MEWVKSGATYHLSEPFSTAGNLPTAIYIVQWDSNHNRFELRKTKKKFDFPYKIYDLDKEFIDRVVKTHHEMNKNLGVLLYGTKGTGKTVASKMICNALNIPVLIINKEYQGLETFINSIPHEVVVMIDEYEKIFGDRSNKLLTLMDGILDNGAKRVFLLTCNELYINSNLQNRPGRIRYKKEYSDMSGEAIRAIVDDLLEHKEFRDEIIEYISFLEIITIDIIKAIISEVNIHNESLEVLGPLMNVHKTKPLYNIIKIGDGKESRFAKKKYIRDLEDVTFDENDLESETYFCGSEYTITEVHGPYEISCIRGYGDNIKTYRFRFEPVSRKHKYFR